MAEAKTYWLHLNRHASPGTTVTYSLVCAPDPGDPGNLGGGYPTAHYTWWEVLLTKLHGIHIPESVIAEAGRELNATGHYIVQSVRLTQQQLIGLELPIVAQAT